MYNSMEEQISDEDEEENKSEPSPQELSQKLCSNKVHIINLSKKTCRESCIEEIMNPQIIKLMDAEYLFVIIDPSTDSITKIRKAFNFHPILDYECSYSNSHSIDHMFEFVDCLFIALIDIPASEELTHPASMKILIIEKAMFLFLSEKIACVEEVLCNSMGFDIFQESSKNEFIDIIRKSTEYIRNIKIARRSAIQICYDDTELSQIELVLHKILHMMFIRIEEIIAKVDEEVVNCIDFVTNLSINESNEFIIRMNLAQKNLSLCSTYVKRKIKLFPQLVKSKVLGKTFSEYLISMSLNMNKLEKRIKSSKRTLKSYANVYNSYVDEGINQSSLKLNKLLQVFSAITAIFLPLNLMAAFMGMNIQVPFMVNKYPDSIWPFSTIIMFSVCYFIFIVMLFKAKSWL